MAATSNPVSTLDPVNYGAKGEGLCSDFYPGPTGIDLPTGAAYPYPVTLEKGDTAIVGARISDEPVPGFAANVAEGTGLSANFTLDGLDVVVKGTTSSDPGPGQGLSFTYSTR
jgi:hypothetical protein